MYVKLAITNHENLIIIGAQIQGQAGFVNDTLKVLNSYNVVGFLDNNKIYIIKILMELKF